jgi:hypothetical protein
MLRWWRKMLIKLLAGGLGTSLVALLLVFNMLMSSKEANGELRGAVSEAAGVNARQSAVVAALEAAKDDLLAGIEAAEARAQAATDELIASQAGLVTAKNDFEGRLAAARRELTHEELVCAVQPVPDSYINSLRAQSNSPDGP